MADPHDPPQTSAQQAAALYQIVEQLYPLCRSISGDGVRQTLAILQQTIALTIHEVPSGTTVFDWRVPREWNVKEAFLRNAAGDKVLDFRKSNLHLLNYSIPMRGHFSLAELEPHLFYLPQYPDWIPYRTSYYEDNWGFCLSYNQFKQLKDEVYEVVIDTRLTAGFLTYGEFLIEGQSSEEVLISAHLCHPSLCNDNLSGLAVATRLAHSLMATRPRYSYRFLFIPGTIGSITWLARNEGQVHRIRHGLVAVCLGDGGTFTYKKSRQGEAEIDRMAAHVLTHGRNCADLPPTIVDFSPYGYDERQYCSPGFNLPVGCLMRTPHGQYPQYHTSADNLSFVSAENLLQSLHMVSQIVQGLEENRYYLNLNPKCEPQLGKRGLYQSIGGQEDGRTTQLALLWILNLADGEHSLLDIAERSGFAIHTLAPLCRRLMASGLLQLL